jgi:hypothetical protein
MAVVGSLRQASWDGFNQLPVPKPSQPTVLSGDCALGGQALRASWRFQQKKVARPLCAQAFR